MFHDMEPEDYAAMWGCDPVYDRWPRERGDGYRFYNYSSEQHDLSFLRDFIPAIDRTIKSVQLNPDSHESHDLDDLHALRDYVENQLLNLV